MASQRVKGAAATQLLGSTAIPDCVSSVAGSFLEKPESSISGRGGKLCEIILSIGTVWVKQSMPAGPL